MSEKTSDTLRSVVVDDEQAARDLLIEILSKRPDLTVVGSYANANQAVHGIRREKPDLVFLDIQMPSRDGFSVLDSLGDAAPAVVFVTAYDQYAVEAFDVSAIDYILKPIDEERVHRAVDRARARLKSGEDPGVPSAITKMIASLREQSDDYLRYMPLKIKERVVLQKAEDISLIEADGKYVRLFIGTEQHLVRRTMHSLEARLDPASFIRVSRSAIVNLSAIAHLEPWGASEWAITLRSGQRVISTYGYREKLQRLLKAK
ncbi:MAG TPA: LytTR family DNA-binding domain-containing protein [Gemmatimonadaceae bacterium]